MLVRALESDWAMLCEEIGLWIPVQVANQEHDDKPEDTEEFGMISFFNQFFPFHLPSVVPHPPPLPPKHTKILSGIESGSSINFFFLAEICSLYLPIINSIQRRRFYLAGPFPLSAMLNFTQIMMVLQ